jgi:hypothetical protein
MVLGMSLRSRGSRHWSWAEVGERTIAVYLAERDQHLRTALLLWQGDDPQVPIDGATPSLIVLTMDLEVEPDAGNAVALAGFDSLEAARARCVDWVGAAAEVDLTALGETAQIGIYAAIRQPSFAAGG